MGRISAMEFNVSYKHTLNPRHVHYWVCGEADNGVVRAQCRYCGEIRPGKLPINLSLNHYMKKAYSVLNAGNSYPKTLGSATSVELKFLHNPPTLREPHKNTT